MNANDNKPAPEKPPAKPPEKQPPTEQQWQLALAHLAAGDRAANMLRALLFIAAMALFACAFSMLRPGLKGLPLFAHGASIALCVVAFVSVVKAFRMQSEQAAARFRLLKDGNHEALAQHDSVVEQMRGRQSGFWDRIAIWSLALTFAIQIVAKLLSAAAIVHV